MPTIPDPKFAALEMPWARAMQAQLEAMQADLDRRAQNDLNVNQGQNSTIQNLGEGIQQVATELTNAVDALTLTGIPGNLDQSRVLNTWTKSVSTPGTLAATDVFSSNAPTNVFTGPRVAGWLLNANGQLGTASSSLRFKQDVTLATVDARAVLSIDMKLWHYRAEVAKRDDPNSPDYVGPDYHVALNFGPIAEEIHAAGLWMCVVYERNEDQSLKLGDDGQPIPFAVHDALWGYVLHTAIQWLSARVDDIEGRLTRAGI